MLASKIAYSARNSAGSLRLKALEFAEGLNGVVAFTVIG